MPLRAVTWVLAALALTGCAIGTPPDAVEVRGQALPNTAVPGRYVAAGGSLDRGVSDNWLTSFNDPRLEALVREALVYNTDLRIAAARVEQAAGFAKAAGAAIYPTVNALARGGGKLGGDTSGLSGVGLFANWEIDIWGRARAAREAGRFQYLSTEADAEFARQSIAASVAKSWFLAIEARQQLALAEEIVRSSEQTVGLAGDRLKVGKGDEYDVTLAEANQETFRDASRQLSLGLEQALRALEILIGRYPAAALELPNALPPMPGPVPVGLPSELLERRPDVIAAERRVAAAFYRVHEAKAARLPKIALTAGVTSISSELFVLQSHSNPVASIGANILAPIFSGFALEGQVDVRTAEQKIAIADYGRIGARAFNDVESALSAGFAADEREVILQRAVTSNGRTLELAQVRFRVGSGDLRAVLQQNIALYSSRTALLRMQSERRVQRVNLHLALGGSFDNRPVTEPSKTGENAAPAFAQSAPTKDK